MGCAWAGEAELGAGSRGGPAGQALVPLLPALISVFSLFIPVRPAAFIHVIDFFFPIDFLFFISLISAFTFAISFPLPSFYVFCSRFVAS